MVFLEFLPLWRAHVPGNTCHGRILVLNAHCAKSSNIFNHYFQELPGWLPGQHVRFSSIFCFHATNQGELAWSQEVLELLESLEAEATRDPAPSAKGCPAVSCGLKMVTMTSAWQITSCIIVQSGSLMLSPTDGKTDLKDVESPFSLFIGLVIPTCADVPHVFFLFYSLFLFHEHNGLPSAPTHTNSWRPTWYRFLANIFKYTSSPGTCWRSWGSHASCEETTTKQLQPLHRCIIGQIVSWHLQNRGQCAGSSHAQAPFEDTHLWSVYDLLFGGRQGHLPASWKFLRKGCIMLYLPRFHLWHSCPCAPWTQRPSASTLPLVA